MDVVEQRFSPDVLETYAAISTEYEVTSVVDLDALRQGSLVPIPVDLPYTKDLDDEDPRDWPLFYDLDGWAIFLAIEDGTAVGACAIATGVTSVYFETEPWEAILWDIRVAPEHRGRGIASALLDAAATWARLEECLNMLIETQDTNFAACKLYRSAHGFVSEVRPGAYANHPDEALIVWSVALS